MSTIKFPSLIGKAANGGASRYVIDNVFVSAEGDAVATDGRIMAIVQAEHSDGETVDSKGVKKPIPATAAVLVPAKLGPTKAADVKAIFSVNGTTSKTDHKGAMTTLAANTAGRFPRCYDVLPEITECRELTIKPAQLLALMQSLNTPGTGESSENITLLLPADPTRAIGVVAGDYVETLGIGVVMPFKEDGKQLELYTKRRKQLSRLEGAITQYHDSLKAN